MQDPYTFHKKKK